MKSKFLSAVLPLAIVASASAGVAASAERDADFFRSVEGQWTGPGEIVAGKYKGTKFTCRFTGATPAGKVGMSLDGDCRVGVFSQPMSASIERKGRSGYKGSFMGGSSGNGLDIVAGSVVDPRKVVFSINRNQLRGVMQARVPDGNSMIVTVSVKVEDRMVPVIGMNLKRVDAASVGAVAKN